jgi:hypothetical protein
MGTIWPGTKEIDAYGRWTGRVYNSMACQWTDSPMYPGTDAGRLNLERRTREQCPPTITQPPPEPEGPMLDQKTWPACVEVSGSFAGQLVVVSAGCVRETYGPDATRMELMRDERARGASNLAYRLRCGEAPAFTLVETSAEPAFADAATAARLCEELRQALECANAPRFGVQFFGTTDPSLKRTEQRYRFRVFPLYEPVTERGKDEYGKASS